MNNIIWRYDQIVERSNFMFCYGRINTMKNFTIIIKTQMNEYNVNRSN